MEKTVKYLGASTLLLTVSIAVSACKHLTAENAKTALDVAKVACLINNAFLQDEHAMKVCNIILGSKEEQAARDILGDTRKTAQRYAAEQKAANQSTCYDGGAPNLDGGKR